MSRHLFPLLRTVFRESARPSPLFNTCPRPVASPTTPTNLKLSTPSNCVQCRHAHAKKLIQYLTTKKKDRVEIVKEKSKLDTLFHPLYKSPFPALQARGKEISAIGSCPTCVHEHPKEEDIAKRKKSVFYCPDCGFPTHCSPEHYAKDVEEHSQMCDVLKQINEDEHDIRSGRTLSELDLNFEHDPQDLVNFTNWETFIRTRQLPGFDEDEEMEDVAIRHVSKLLTYPMTMASLLYRNSPFTELLTTEGQKSLNAFSKTLNEAPTTSQQRMKHREHSPRETIRIFVIDPRGEATLPADAWAQFQVLFPTPAFQIHFIGKGVPVTAELPNDRAIEVNSGLTLHYHQTTWHDEHAELVGPFDLYRDVFFLFHPGFGHHIRKSDMRPTLMQLLETKCAIFCTAFNEEDLERDIKSLEEEDVADEIDWLLNPTVNPFRSLRFEADPLDLRNLAQKNWSVYGIRGKRYEVTYPKDDLLHQLIR